MRLAIRMALIVTSAVSIGILAIFWIAGVVLVDGFKEVEAQTVDREIGFLQGIVAQDVERLDRTTKDWAHWNDTVAFMAGEAPDYPEANIQVASMKANQIQFMAFMDPEGRLVYGRGLVGDRLGPPPTAFSNGSWPSLGLDPDDDAGGRVAGLVHLDRPYLIAARTILHGDETGPPAGTLVWGRAFDAGYIEGLGQRSGLPLVLAPPEVEAPADHRRIESSWASMTVHATLYGLDGRPFAVLEYDAPRPIFQQGIESMTYFFVMAVGSSIVILIVGLFVVRSNVTGPVGQLAARMQRLADGHDDPPLDSTRDDEVGRLSRIFDDLIEQLHASIAELRRSNQDLEDFARVASHDLQSPLSTFNLNLRLLRPHLEDNEAALREIGRMERASARMSQRVAALLAYSRARSRPLEIDDVALDDVLAVVLADLQADIEATGAVIDAGPLPHVEADAAQVEQLLQNLLSNAVKYHKDGQGSRVAITGGASGDSVWIAVSDNGIGFDPAQADQVLRPFTRLPNAQERPGDGIGMATCQRIVERHGGRLSIEGALGVGATFTVYLPRRHAEPGFRGRRTDQEAGSHSHVGSSE